MNQVVHSIHVLLSFKGMTSDLKIKRPLIYGTFKLYATGKNVYAWYKSLSH